MFPWTTSNTIFVSGKTTRLELQNMLLHNTRRQIKMQYSKRLVDGIWNIVPVVRYWSFNDGNIMDYIIAPLSRNRDSIRTYVWILNTRKLAVFWNMDQWSVHRVASNGGVFSPLSPSLSLSFSLSLSLSLLPAISFSDQIFGANIRLWFYNSGRVGHSSFKETAYHFKLVSCFSHLAIYA